MVGLEGNPVAHLTEYELRHLPEHLKASGRAADLHRLLWLRWVRKAESPHVHLGVRGWLTRLLGKRRGPSRRHDNAWYAAKEAVGDIAGYLADVQLAWQLAKADVGLQIRYALITTSLNSQASNIQPALLVTLVEEGVWTSAQGLVYARQMPDLEQRANALVRLAPYLPGSLLHEALESALQIVLEKYQAETLIGLAPYLPEPSKSEALQRALASARAIQDSKGRVETLAELVPYLSEPQRQDLLQEALMVAWTIEHEYNRVRTLVRLASRLPEPSKGEILQEALTAAQLIEGEKGQVMALLDLAPCIAEMGYPQDALRMVRTAQADNVGTWYLTAVLAELVPYLSKSLLSEALEAAQALEAKQERATALAALAPYVPEPLKGKTLRNALRAARAGEMVVGRLGGKIVLPAGMARTVVELKGGVELKGLRFSEGTIVRLSLVLPDGTDTGVVGLIGNRQLIRAMALASLIPYLPQSKGKAVLQEALMAARRIDDEIERVEALLALIPHLPGSLKAEVLQEALTTVPAIGDRSDCAVALVGLVPHLPDSLLREALTAVQEIRDEDRAEALAELACHLAESGHPQEALTAVREIKEERLRAVTLATLAPYMPEPLLEEAVEVARKIRDGEEQTKVLAVLARHLQEPLRGKVLREALDLARTIDSGRPSVKEMGPLAQSFQSVLSGPDPRSRALAELAHCLTELDHVQDALTAVWEIEDRSLWKQAMTEVTPHLSETLLRQTLAAALETWDDAQAAALPGLVRELAKLGYPEDALAAARGVPFDIWGSRAQALVGLVSCLPKSLKDQVLGEALAAVREIDWERESTRTTVLTEAQKLWELERKAKQAEVFSGLAETLLSEAGLRRTLLVSQVKLLGKLIPHLSEQKFEVLREALTTAQMIEQSHVRATVLAELASNMPEPMREETLRQALAAAQTIEESNIRAAALVESASNMPEPMREETLRQALAAVREIEDESEQARVVVNLTRELWELGYPEKALILAQQIRDAESLDRLASLRSPKLTKLSYPGEAVAAAQAIADERVRVRALTWLIPHLPEELRAEALQEAIAAAQAIRDESHRAQVLVELAPHLPDLLLRQALEIALTIRDEPHRARALAELALQLAKTPHQYLCPLWEETLSIVSSRTRKALLSDLRALGPVVAALGGQEAAAGAFHAIRDVSHWWP